ncbi:hypothetical protein [Hymenobacter sp. BT190]|uniref:hypothetical protein n=1 Tax=Hymenobacter sp. BT190 TaxID=2763505 RepID=UPI0016515D13|nr:hypothetical protein [Hymenobacter sp. BT190]MBC6699915.1 hypothetical protein [Hymenobacter sp. BT190]
MLRNLLLIMLLSGAAASTQAQNMSAPPLAPLPATATTGGMPGVSAGNLDPIQTVTLDTTPVKLRIDPRKPLPDMAPARSAPRPKPKPRQ